MNKTTIGGDVISPQRWISSTTEEILSETSTDPLVGDEISRFSRPLLSFAAVLTIIIMLVGIFGNLLTILALLKCPKVRNVAAAFIISLCLADCLFCAIVLPFSAFRFIQGTWTHGDFLCRLIPFIQYGNIGVSLLCIAMITINRYIMIAHHSGYSKIYKRHWIGLMIAFCWFFSYGMQLPTLFGVWGTFDYDSKLGTCSIMLDENGRSSKTALFVIAFVIPCLIIIGCYAKIFWVVHMSEVRLRQHANKQNSIPNNLRPMPSCPTSNGTSNRMSSPVSSSSLSTTSGAEASKYGTSQKTLRVKDQRDLKAKRNEWRITKMVLAIFLSFVVCYLPITVVKIVDQDVYSPGWHVFSYIMLYLSACINPIIYVIMNKQYRKAYKTVLMCQPSRLVPFVKPGSSGGEKWKDIGCSYNPNRTIVSQVSVGDQQTSSNSCSSNLSPVVLELSLQTLPPTTTSTTTLTNGHTSPILSTSKSSDPTSNSIKTTTMDANSQNLSTIDTFTTLNKMNSSNNVSYNGNSVNSNDNNNSHQAINQNNLSTVLNHPLQLFTRIQGGTPRQGSRITLGEGDIIVEEEEEEEGEESNAREDDKDEHKKFDERMNTESMEKSLETPTSLVTFPAQNMNPFISRETTTPMINLSMVEKDPQCRNDYKQNINVIPDSTPKVVSKLSPLSE